MHYRLLGLCAEYVHICEVSAREAGKGSSDFIEAICTRRIFIVDSKEYIDRLRHLENTVWITRKNRINAEERLLCINRFVQHINIYYACLSAAIAIFTLWYSDKALAMLGAILAPIVTICIAFLNSQRYEQRAADIKRNYIELQKVLYKVQRLELEENSDLSKLEEIENEYCGLMDKVENHRSCDHWKTCAQSNCTEGNAKENTPEKGKTFWEFVNLYFPKVCYFGYQIISWIMHALAYLAPFAAYVLLRFLFDY